MKKALIFDASSIISLALNNLLDALEKLKASSPEIKFLITPQVKRESIDVPLNIRRFELEALMIKNLVDHNVLEVFDHPKLKDETKKVMSLTNSAYRAEEFIKIIHEGEASCFAAYKLLEDYNSVLVIDERTARILSENPENLRQLFEKKLHRNVSMQKSNVDYVKNIPIIRSSELCLAAYKKGVIHVHADPKKAVEALLFAVKFKGCSISREEIEQAKVIFTIPLNKFLNKAR